MIAACSSRRCAAPAPTIGKTSRGIRLRRNRAPHQEDVAMKRSSPPTRRAAPSIACETIAWNGGCTDTNEFNYLVVKTMRGLGLTYIENQARV